ncbi:MAG: hypothetical protein GXP45_08280 [bacterium]|nr:hypothetical protein [bacterium]
MQNASTQKITYTQANKDQLIQDYIDMIQNTNSPLRKNYEDAMTQLDNDAKDEQKNNNANILQIMTASILNFQQNGEGMKYLWTRNNTKSNDTNNTENQKETLEVK